MVIKVQLQYNVDSPIYIFILFFSLFPLVENGTISSLLEDLEDLLDEVAILLDKETPGLRNWQHFARRFDISMKECDDLKPKGIPSPTKKLMEYIVQVNPDLSLKQLIQTLIKMNRHDVVTALRKFFCGKNYLRYVEK